MTKTNRNIASTVALLLICMGVLTSCVGNTQPPISQEQQLRATIVALETQIALGQQPAQVTPIVSSPSSQEQQLQATTVALQTQAAPSPTMPSPTDLPDTPPGSILDVGETWRQGGLELLLKEASLGFDWLNSTVGIYLKFTLTSRKPQDIAIRYNLGEVVSAIDNLGRRLEVDVADSSQRDYDIQTVNIILRSGETVYLVDGRGDVGRGSVFVYADTVDPAVTEIIVTCSISSITEARWRIQIPH